MLITSTTLGSAADATTATYGFMPYARGFAQKFASPPPPIVKLLDNAVFTVCSRVIAKKICCQRFLSNVITKLVKVSFSIIHTCNLKNPAVYTVGANAIPKNNSDRTTLSIPVEKFLNPTALLYYIWRQFFGQLARFVSIFNQFSHKCYSLFAPSALSARGRGVASPFSMPPLPTLANAVRTRDQYSGRSGRKGSIAFWERTLKNCCSFYFNFSFSLF
jgi:hypothetical protein